jgi:hypothetical protein
VFFDFFFEESTTEDVMLGELICELSFSLSAKTVLFWIGFLLDGEAGVVRGILLCDLEEE